MPPAIYIAEIKIARNIEQKINQKHNVTLAEVREAYIMRNDTDLEWEDHPTHGRRVVGFGTTYAGRLLFAALYPIDPTGGVWALASARSPRR